MLFDLLRERAMLLGRRAGGRPAGGRARASGAPLCLLFWMLPGGLAGGFPSPFWQPDLRFVLPDLLPGDLAAFGSLLGKQNCD